MSVELPPPPPETEDAILGLVVRQFPAGGAQHERAIRLAVRLTWAAALATEPKSQELRNE